MSQHPPKEMSQISFKVVFSGGLENLFSSKPAHNLAIEINLPALVPVDNSTKFLLGDRPSAETKSPDIAYLIHYLRDKHLKERVELFMDGGSV
jgi:hypothetical protein